MSLQWLPVLAALPVSVYQSWSEEYRALTEDKLTGITSRPIPSPGIRPIRKDLEAIV